MPDLIQPFTRATRPLVSAGARLLVAVSGGPDSVALLDLSDRARTRLRVEPIVVHFDHDWRIDSADDAAFVGQMAADRGLTFVVERGTNVAPSEAAGRSARLAFFARAAAEYGAAAVLLGHSADDQGETVLMHLLRGSGVNGLGGMRAATDLGDLRLVRPLLGMRRAALRSYCLARGLEFRDDPSNRDPRFLRNRVRLELLPVMEQLAPGAIAALVRLADVAAADAEVVARAVQRAWPDVVECGSAAIAVDRPAFRAQPIAVQRGLVRRIGTCVLGPAPDLAMERVEAARAAILGGRGGAVIEWSARVVVRIEGRRAIFDRSAR